MRTFPHLILLSMLLLQRSTLWAQTEDKWLGSYLNRQSGIYLQVKPKSDGLYSGEFRYGDMTFPIRGMLLLGVFAGEYLHQEKWFSFTLTASRGAFALAVDGVTLPMERLPPGSPPPQPKTPANTGTQPPGKPPAVSSSAIEGKENAAWTQKLKGRQLIFLETSGGGTQKATINLYPDGRFQYEYSSSYSSGGYADFSYADQDKDQGTWKIVEKGGMVVLASVSSKSGQKAEMRIQPGASATQVLINGKRFFIGETLR